MKRLTSFILHTHNTLFSERSILTSVLMVIAIFFSCDTQAAFSKHSTSIVETISSQYQTSEYLVSNLNGGPDGPDPTKTYYSGYLGTASADVPNYINVVLKDGGLSQNDEGDLVVYLRRTQSYSSSNINHAQPVAFGVKALRTDDKGNLSISSNYIFNVYFQFRGYGTEEYSVRIPIKDIWNRLPSSMNGEKISQLRFFTLQTNDDYTYTSKNNKLRETALNSFDVLRIPHDAPFSDTWADRFHLITDGLTELKEIEFINTRGVFDEPSRPEGWEEITEADEAYLRSKGINIDFPNYKLLDSNTSSYPLASGQKRQPAHTVEHILYAMPGDVIPLYPYYDLPNPSINQFQENFSHWYDYKTGGSIQYDSPWNEKYELLDFLNNPTKVQITDKYGFFGGKGMNCSKEYKISSEQQYIEAVKEINKNKNYGDAYIEILNDLDFSGISDVPMLGDYFPFKGLLNGNGHKISNLIYNFPDSVGIGLVGKTEGNVLIENIILSESCRFSGSWRVGGIVGLHNSGTLTIRNIHSEAWVYGVRQNNEQNAAGILGGCPETTIPTSINIEDCYIGGKIGNEGTNISNSFNAAIIGGLWATTGISKFKNIIANCELTGRENVGQPNKVYIRHGQNNYAVLKQEGVISQGNLRFVNCYGNIDPSDECWIVMNKKLEIPSDGLTMLKDAGWKDATTPTMLDTNLSSGYTKTYSIDSADKYIEVVKEINNQKLSNVYIELSKNIDFSETEETVPIIYEGFSGTQYKIFINGRGHTISNLHIVRTVSNTDNQNVGLVGIVGGDTRIENLIIDNSCSIEAYKADSYKNWIYVGIVSRLFGGKFIAKNFKSEATIINDATWGYTGGLLGFCGYEQNDNYLEFENIYIGGKIGNKNCSALVGCLRTGDRSSAITTSTFKNIVVDCAISNPRESGNVYIGQDENTNVVSDTKDSNNNKHFTKTLKNKHNISYTNDYQNCYGNLNPSDLCWIRYDYSLIFPSIGAWINETTPDVRTIQGHEKLRGNGDRLPGTMATFFCPRNPYDNSLFQSLPLNGEKEYIIAADFSQRFDPISQIIEDDGSVKVMEPAIAFRHIFRIRDGKQFADDISGSVENNLDYIRRNQKRVSARTGVPFQIRLDFPAPVVGAVSMPHSNYYYKISDDYYGRVYGFSVKVFNGDTREELSGNQGFYTGAEYYGRGVREINGIKYDVLDGCNSTNQRYHRMLQNNNPVEGHYIVQIIGLNAQGDRIKITNSNEDLVVMEYNIIFLPPKGGTMLTEEELYSKDSKDNYIYETAQVEYLNENFGGEKKEPTTYIDFDEYLKINQLIDNDALKNKLIAYINYDKGKNTPSTPTPNGMENSYFKWPVPWNQSNYSFGYNYRQDYNMYMLTTHSDCTPYMLAAQTWTNNMPGDYPGLYDRSYYDSMRAYKNSQTRAAETDQIKQGYFYYVNAASDPGVTARLTINDLCQGSTIHVSAWMAEFSKDVEKANLSFNFVAVLADGYEESHPNSGLKGGDRVVLHSFITGEVKKVGEWLNIYYSFVPRLAEFSNEGIKSDDVDHYEVELDNNAKSSAGADYAIDNIRVYVEPPIVDAQQIRPTCDQQPTRIRMTSPFETLLEIAGASETLSNVVNNNDLTIYYTFINKSLFESKIKEYKGQADAEFLAFKDAVIKFSYNRGNDDEELLYGRVDFNSRYVSNLPYPDNIEVDEENPDESGLNPFGVGYYKTDAQTGERLLIFESDVTYGKFDEGNQYYILLKASDNEVSPESFSTSSNATDDPERNVWDFFDMYGQCANKNVITIKKAVIVRLDGVVLADKDKIVVCENQSPIIQVNVWGKSENADDSSGEGSGNVSSGQGDDETTGENEVLVPVNDVVPFDWFRGLVSEFKSITEKDMRPLTGDENNTLENALLVFRAKYPTLQSVSGVLPDPEGPNDTDPDAAPEERLEQWMIDLIEWVSTPSDEYPIPRMLLGRESYMMPPVTLEDGEDEEEVHVAVIPITCLHAFDNYIVCPKANDITVYVRNKAPKLKHGLSYFNYPNNLSDVPLRIGLDQLKIDNGAEASTEFTVKKIAIPVHKASSTDNKIDKLVLVKNTRDLVDIEGNKPTVGKEGCIVLAVTNDPEYAALGSGDAMEDKQLLWIGEVTQLTANTYQGAKMEENFFTVKFDNNFIFKEGYFYTLRFDYADDEVNALVSPMADSDPDESEPVICQGQESFTLYIVPKYLLWNGGVTDKTNLNWNNDNNWKRLDQDEIYSTKKDAEHRYYVTDGLNTTSNAYAPLDFTYVVVKDNVEAPYMYAPVVSQVGPSTEPDKYDWPASPSVKDDSKSYSDYPDGENGVGNATVYIQYDMAAFDYGTNKGHGDAETGCRPWYANTCKEIHFKPGGTIMNQQELTYERAWVDMELDHSRWYTVSSPLKEVFAGDFYLPSDGARQKTELYQDITFEKGTHDRFKPAVFQRGWDKSIARVYEIGGPAVDASDVRDVAVKTFWSHVYNDVTVQYGGGVGFSIKTDITDMTSNKPGSDGKVLFRLPKNDSEFLYWEKESNTSGHRTSITRSGNQYRLNDTEGTLTLTSADKCEYFLVGNPFMTHMDIKKFLEENSGQIEQKYWIVTKTGQIAGSVNGETVVAADPSDTSWAEDPTVIAPMQGFFVKTSTPAQSVSLNYYESMMRRYDSRSDHTGEYLTETTRSEACPVLRIVAVTDGMSTSAALLGVNDSTLCNVEAIDNRDLDIPSVVYTIGDGMALSINSVEKAEGVEIGLIADDDADTVIRFEGVECVEGLYLLDKADHSLTPLEEGMEVAVEGSAAGRFFLTYGIADEGVMSGIDWNISGGVLTASDNAASGHIEVNVYDTMGRLVKHEVAADNVIEVSLESGMYVVEISTAKERETAKIRIRR